MDDIFKIMLNDKKSGKKTKIILLKKIGQSFIKETTLKKSFIPLIKRYKKWKLLVIYQFYI